MPLDLGEVHECLIKLAYDAGAMILMATPSSVGAENKKNSADLVTETDRAVELMITESLQARYPDFESDGLSMPSVDFSSLTACSFMGEETYKPGTRLSNRPTFICDPIDGTVNFVHGFPEVCTSIALAIDKQPVVGVIYNPFSQRLYSAIKGKGSFLNRTTRLPLRPSEPLTTLQDSLVAVEWGADRKGHNYRVKRETFQKLTMTMEEGGAMVNSLRSVGSAALNICSVACGVLDVYWEGGAYAWDVAAGWVILQETGGIMVDANSPGWDPPVDGRTYMAVRGASQGQKKIVEEFWSHCAGTLEYSP